MATERSALNSLYEGVLANLELVVWDEYGIPLEMMELYNKQIGISGQSFVNDLIVTGLGYAPEKKEGAASQQDSMYEAGSKKYIPKVRSLMFIVTEEAVTDNKFMAISDSARALTKSLKATKERLAAVPFNNAFSSETSADGVALCSTAHLQYPTGATGKNTLSTAADLSVTSAVLCMNDLDATEDDRGIPTDISADRLVVSNPQMAFLASEIFKSYGRSDTANRADNAFKMMPEYSGMQILKKKWLTDEDAYFFLPADNRDHGLKYKEWWAFKTAHSIDFDTGNLKYKAWERYVFGPTKWQGIYGVPGV